MRQSAFKVIHTSDWHLGQHFMGKSRRAEHQKFLAWLIDTAIENEINAIIVAGDIFDTGAPPSYARELYNQFIVDLQPTGIHLIVLGGNHDSVATLGESKELLACLNTHVVPGALEIIDDQIIVLTDHKQQPAAIVCAVPYLRPRDIQTSVSGQSGDEKKQALQQSISEHYNFIYQLAKKQQEEIVSSNGIKVPIIATGHLTTVGASVSESVRDLYIGTLDAFPANAFPPVDYIALGHIHRSQRVGNTNHIRYSGSPIPLSFDELNSDKSVLMVEFNDGELLQIEPKVVPCFQLMYFIKGDLATVKLEIKALASRYQRPQVAWLDIEIQTQDYLNDLLQRINSFVDGLPVEVLVLRREKKQSLKSTVKEDNETLQELTPIEVFERRLSLESFDDDSEKKTRLIRAFEQIVASRIEKTNVEDNVEREMLEAES